MPLNELEMLKQLISDSEKIVVFTGAGISTESGIPDFRGPSGIWKTMTPIDFGDFIRSESVRIDSWQRKFSGDSKMSDAAPNAGHLAVSRLADQGKLTGVITQNVDGLHQKSGLKDKLIVELHGNANYASCLSCGLRVELADVELEFKNSQRPPHCKTCDGMIKTATISFGQPMPVAQMQRAEEMTNECDLFLAIGSSLVVYPAASFPAIAKQQGAKLVIINNDATDLDPMADLVIHQGIGQTLQSAIT